MEVESMEVTVGVEISGLEQKVVSHPVIFNWVNFMFGLKDTIASLTALKF